MTNKRNLQVQTNNNEDDASVKKQKKKNKEDLKKLYSAGKRSLELLSVLTTSTVLTVNLILLIKREVEREEHSYLMILVAGGGGMGVADFLSGLVHWGADSYGSVDLPLVGAAFIRPFREHHLAPTLITTHDFIETNGDNFLLPLIPMVILSLNLMQEGFYQSNVFLSWFFYLLAVLVAFTNQIHKWSHTRDGGIPWGVRVMQDWGLILGRKEHREHHRGGHESHFCITTGWLNKPLEKLNFWRNFECLIETLTGIKPRVDDMEWAKGD